MVLSFCGCQLLKKDNVHEDKPTPHYDAYKKLNAFQQKAFLLTASPQEVYALYEESASVRSDIKQCESPACWAVQAKIAKTEGEISQYVILRQKALAYGNSKEIMEFLQESARDNELILARYQKLLQESFTAQLTLLEKAFKDNDYQTASELFEKLDKHDYKDLSNKDAQQRLYEIGLYVFYNSAVAEKEYNKAINFLDMAKACWRNEALQTRAEMPQSKLEALYLSKQIEFIAASSKEERGSNFDVLEVGREVLRNYNCKDEALNTSLITAIASFKEKLKKEDAQTLQTSTFVELAAILETLQEKIDKNRLSPTTSGNN